MSRSSLIIEALEKLRLSESGKFWKDLEAFDMGVAIITVPVLEDSKEIFKLRLKVEVPDKEEVEQTSLF